MKTVRRAISVFFPSAISIILVPISLVYLNDLVHGFASLILSLLSIRAIIVAAKGKTHIDDFSVMRVVCFFINLIIIVTLGLINPLLIVTPPIIPIVMSFFYFLIISCIVLKDREIFEILLADPLIYYTLLTILFII